ncbi:MAG: class I SAM-dependent methyltransferase [Spirochaetota bacterium]
MTETMNRGITPAQAKEFYDRFGAKQDRQGWYEDPAVERMRQEANLGSATNVFELGHGTGRLAERLLRNELPAACHYTGTDVSETMHGLADARLAPWSDRVTLIRADAHDPPLAGLPAGYDRIIATYVIDLMEADDIRTTLCEAWRMLVPGGRLCVVSLTFGRTPFTRLVSWLWERIQSIAPARMGGCRPISPSRLVSEDEHAWRIEHASVVCRFGVCSEVVVAVRAGNH